METNVRHIIIMKGIPGSGKSTKAKEYVSQGYKKVGKDELRRMINNYSLDNSDEAMIDDIQRDIIRRFMSRGRNVVVDNTHAKEKYINSLLKHITACTADLEFEYDITIDFLDVDLDVAIERNAKREKTERVPENVIKSMYNSIKK